MADGKRRVWSNFSKSKKSSKRGTNARKLCWQKLSLRSKCIYSFILLIVVMNTEAQKRPPLNITRVSSQHDEYKCASKLKRLRSRQKKQYVWMVYYFPQIQTDSGRDCKAKENPERPASPRRHGVLWHWHPERKDRASQLGLLSCKVALTSGKHIKESVSKPFSTADVNLSQY